MLILQCDEGAWLIALWRKRKQYENGGEIKPDTWSRARKTWMKSGERRENWLRVAIKSPTLAMGLAHILNHTHPRVSMEHMRSYLRSVEWGKALPL